jgi:hypothetical protein
MAKTNRKRGRPSIAAEDRRRNIVSIGMTDTLKLALEMLAVQEGCSLSRAIELSLERYFHAAYTYGETHELQMYGRLMATAFAVGGRIAAVSKAVVKDANDPSAWIDDPYAYDHASREVIRALVHYRPEGQAEGPALDFLDNQDRTKWLGPLLSFWETQKNAPQSKRSNFGTHLADSARKNKDAATVVQIIQLQDRLRRLRQEAEKTAAEIEAHIKHRGSTQAPAAVEQVKPKTSTEKNERTHNAKKPSAKN